MDVRNLPQDVTWWPITGKSEFSGFTFGTPVVIKGRWEDRSVLVRSPEGEEVTSRAVVYTDRDIVEGDYIALGDLDDVSDPTTLAAAFRVMQFLKVPNLAGVRMTRSAFI